MLLSKLVTIDNMFEPILAAKSNQFKILVLHSQPLPLLISKGGGAGYVRL